MIINESAFRLTGWESIEGKVLKDIPTPEQAFGRASPSEYENNSLNVVGVIKDINVEKLASRLHRLYSNVLIILELAI